MNDNDFEIEKAQGFQDLISAIFRQAIKDEVGALTRNGISDLSVKEFIRSGKFSEYADKLIGIQEDFLFTKFWENIVVQTNKRIKKKDLQISMTFLIEEEAAAFKKYI